MKDKHIPNDPHHDPHQGGKPPRDEKPKRGKGRGGFFLAGFITGVAVMVALYFALLYFFDGFAGLGGGSSAGVNSDTGNSSVSSQAQPTESETESEPVTTKPETEQAPTAEAGGNVVIIEVNADAVVIGEESFTDAASVKAYLQSVNTDETTYILRDNRAVKSLYDEVEKVLAELHFEYASETV